MVLMLWMESGRWRATALPVRMAPAARRPRRRGGYGPADDAASFWNRHQTYALYLSSVRTGLRRASRRNGSPSSRVHIISTIVVLPSFWALQASRSAAPTSETRSTVTPSAPIDLAMPAKLGFSRFTPRNRLL